uniref:Uncharacterized protein n=1 Tax=Megaselia scalaris TaxID=36166 RepID=T1GVQ2_MEGSC
MNSRLLNVHPGARISSQDELGQTQLLRKVDFKTILEKRSKPPFKPPEDHLNCDPCLELEEMIVEAKPLHKKKKRLAKQRSQQKDSDTEPNLVKEFIVYNRYKELNRKAMEKKENEWQKELELYQPNKNQRLLKIHLNIKFISKYNIRFIMTRILGILCKNELS